MKQFLLGISDNRRNALVSTSLTGIALALSLGFGAVAQAAPTAYWSAGATCGNAAPTDFTPGNSITVSLCTTGFAANEYVCDFSTQLQTDDATGLFKASRVLNPGFTALTNPASPVTILPDPTVSPLDWGGHILPMPPVPMDPSGVDFLLATFTFSTDAAATVGPYTIELGQPGYPEIGISPSNADCLASTPVGLTASLTLTPTAPPPDTEPPVMTSLNCGGAALTNVTTRTITFSATDNVGVTGYECSLNGAAFAACTSPQNLAGLADGAQTFVVQALDAAGNRSTAASGTCEWTIDTIPPAAPVFTSTPPDPDTSQTVSFAFTGEAGANFQCSLNGGAFTACTSPTTRNLTTPGNQTFSVRAVDAAGNTGPAATYDWEANFTSGGGVGAASIPTLSEWSLILLGLLLAGFGMSVAARNRRMC